MRQDISLLMQHSFSKSSGKVGVMDMPYFIRDKPCLKVNIISKNG
jgi:hypothetical protein